MLSKYATQIQSGAALIQAVAVVVGIAFAVYQTYFNADTLYMDRYDRTMTIVEELNGPDVRKSYYDLLEYGQKSQAELNPNGGGFSTEPEVRLFSAAMPYVGKLGKLKECLEHRGCEMSVVRDFVCEDLLMGAAMIETKRQRVAPAMRDREMATMRYHVYPLFELRDDCLAYDPRFQQPIVEINPPIGDVLRKLGRQPPSSASHGPTPTHAPPPLPSTP